MPEGKSYGRIQEKRKTMHWAKPYHDLTEKTIEDESMITVIRRLYYVNDQTPASWDDGWKKNTVRHGKKIRCADGWLFARAVNSNEIFVVRVPFTDKEAIAKIKTLTA